MSGDIYDNEFCDPRCGCCAEPLVEGRCPRPHDNGVGPIEGCRAAFDLRARAQHLEALLKEARGWLCEHPGAPLAPQYKNGQRLRYWCTHCKSYLRSAEDYTLTKRIDQALGGSGE